MAEMTAADRLQKFMDTGPQPSQYMKSRVIGKGKNAQGIQELDQKSFNTAKEKFLNENRAAIDSLQKAVDIENKNADLGSQQKSLDVQQQGKNQAYLDSPTHDWYSQYGNEPAAFGPAILATAFNRFTGSPRAGANIARILAPYLGEGIVTGGLGYLGKQRADQIEKTDPKSADVDRFWGNVGEGWGLGSVLGGGFKAAKGAPSEVGGGPGPKGEGNNPPPAPSLPTNAYKGLTPTDATRKLLRDLGVDPAKIPDARKDGLALLPKAIAAADDTTVRKAAAAFPGIDPNETDAGAIRSALKAAGVPGGRLLLNKRFASLLGPVGTGLAGGLELFSNPPDAYAGPLEKAEDLAHRAYNLSPFRTAQDVGTSAGAATKALLSPAPDRSVIETPMDRLRARLADEPSRALEEARSADADAGDYMVPYGPREGAQIHANSNLDQAIANDQRQRRELLPKREEVGSDAVRAKAREIEPSRAGDEPQSSAFVSHPYYDDLPDYEKEIIRSGKSPHEAALQAMPFIRASAEAARRGEDPEGGSDTFEKSRRALNWFYNVAAKDASGAMASGPQSEPENFNLFHGIQDTASSPER